MTDNFHLTAMSRKVLPAPTQWLLSSGLIRGETLDYGCGKCHEINNQHFPCDGYDPHFQPDGKTRTEYDTIICNYVLNVIPYALDRWVIIVSVLRLLSPTGISYFSVRNDRRKLNGYTTRGTWQGVVYPPGELIHKTSSYRLYRLTKQG